MDTKGLQIGRRLGDYAVITDTRTGEVVMRVRVQKIEMGKVRLGFDGPKHFRISREDITEDAREELWAYNNDKNEARRIAQEAGRDWDNDKEN